MNALSIGFNATYHEDTPTIEEIITKEGNVILEFGAPWCGHCRAAASAIETALSKRKLPHIKIFDGKGKVLGRHYKVTRWPTLILLVSGNEVGRLVRPTDADTIETLLEMIQA